MYQSFLQKLKSEFESPFFIFKVICSISVILFALTAISQQILFTKAAGLPLRAAEASVMLILSLFLVIQNRFNKHSPILFILGAAVFCHALFTLLSLLNYFYTPFGWELTAGSLCTSLILNAGRFFPSSMEARVIRNYTIPIFLVALMVILIELLYSEQLGSPVKDGRFSTTFKTLNIIAAFIMFFGCLHLKKLVSPGENKLSVPLIYFFTFIALTRFFAIFFGQEAQLTWWLINVMRYGTTIIALSFLVSAYQASLMLIEKRNEELQVEAKNNAEKQIIIEEQRAQIFHSAQMSSIAKLSGIMAHEINNPLTSISLNTEFLIKRDNQNLTPQQEKRIENIYALTKRINEIIKRFLILSELKQASQTKLTELKEIIDNTVEFSGTSSVNDISLIVDPVPQVRVKCNPIHISQALLNLLFNSFEAVKNSSLKWVRVTFETHQDKVIIRIIDNGEGISPDIVDSIMNPFFTTKDVNEGQGLGLSIAKSYIEEYNGQLYLDKKAANTTFVIELPIEQ